MPPYTGFKWLCWLAALILFLLFTLSVGGVLSGTVMWWALGGGLVALTLALIPLPAP